jgi:hypothetical protein
MRWCDRWMLRVSCQVYNKSNDYEHVGDVIQRLE